jgi:succinoglycan biosynthesis transport protein ExoP
MADLDIRFYIAVFLRRLPYFLAVVLAVTTAAVAAAYLMPRVYRASARVLLETPQVSTNLAGSTIPANAISQLQIVQEKLTTSENLLALARRFEIHDDPGQKLSSVGIVDDMRARLHFEQVQLDAPGGDGATVFNISFDAGRPDLAANVVNDVVALMLSKNVDQRTDRAANAARFFGDEVARLGSELKRLEAEILKFKDKHADALPDGQEFRRNKQSTLQERLLLLEREEAELRSRRNTVVQIYGSTGQIGASAPATAEQQQLQELNRALAEQLAIFSESSPAVTALRARIAALQGQLRTDGAAGPEQKVGPTALDVQLADIDERLAAIAGEVAAVKRELADLAEAIKETPANETVLNALDRDRTNIQTQYNAAVARLAEASTGEQIEVLSKGPRFTVVEPATPPERPISPHRRRIAALGGTAGIGLGIGLIVLLEMLSKTVRRPVDLVQMLEAQPLATIPYIWTGAEVRRARLKRGLALAFAAGVAAVVLVAIHYYYYYYYYLPLGVVLQRLTST